MAWWSSTVTSGSPTEASYSLIRSVNPSAAPDIDIIGVFRLWDIPPINWPREAKRSFSISMSWLSLIACISFLCWVISLNSNKIPRKISLLYKVEISIVKYLSSDSMWISKETVSLEAWAFWIAFWNLFTFTLYFLCSLKNVKISFPLMS